MKTKTNALELLIGELDKVIAAAQAARLGETAALLRIARLDLMMRTHGIAADELELVSFALAHGYCGDDASKPVKAKAARKKKQTRN
jgi:hypothetical protein